MHMRKTTAILLLSLTAAAARAQLLPGVPPPYTSDLKHVTVNDDYPTPTYPDGNKALHDFLKQNLRFPQEAARAVKGAILLMRFTVSKDGTLSDFQPLGFHVGEWDTSYATPGLLPEEQRKAMLPHLQPLFVKEAERTLRLMPKWVPASQNGKHVQTTFTLPLTFL